MNRGTVPVTVVPITVADLIAELQQLDPRARVHLADPDEGAITDGPGIGAVGVRGGDVYLYAPGIDAVEWRRA